MYHILIIEDDKILRYGLAKCLEEEGYAVSSAENAAQAVCILEKEAADLAVLDVNLPGQDGFEFYRRQLSIRGIPTVFLTARDEEADIVKGFDLGAEDYITKPFSIQVFVKKTAAVLRRCCGKEENRIVQGDLTVLARERKVLLREEQVSLSPAEYRLLEVFLRNTKRVLTKELLMESIWEQGAEWVDSHSLAVQISRLRNKLGHACIKTVFGVGYMWVGVADPAKEREESI
ncbi:MAG: response regulator transcription factor [Eubacterium sp.]|nr:response regulator transcription factor [Eubacterium sp.]